MPAVVSAADRDAVNRERLGPTRDRLVARRDELTAEIAGGGLRPLLRRARMHRWYVERKLDDLAAIETELARGDGEARRYLLLLDMDAGRRGHGAIAVGDPDGADHVSVTTAGFNTTLGESLTGSGETDGMGGQAALLRRETLRQLAAAGRGDERVACCVWIGYDAPNSTGPGRLSHPRALFDVVTWWKARHAAPALGRLLVQVRASAPTAHVVAFGHSYGSLVTAYALRHLGSAAAPAPGEARRRVVDEAVFYGSPGLGMPANPLIGYTASEFHLRPAGAYVLENEDDPIASGWFGRDPSSCPGLVHLSTRTGLDATGVLRAGTRQHANYARPVAVPNRDDLPPMSMGAYNMAAVLGGLRENLIRA